MNERIRKLFEEHTVPNFSIGDNLNLSKKANGEYIDPTLEDHWQTFQEAAELIAKEAISVLRVRNEHAVIVNSIKEIKEHFGVE